MSPTVGTRTADVARHSKLSPAVWFCFHALLSVPGFFGFLAVAPCGFANLDKANAAARRLTCLVLPWFDRFPDLTNCELLLLHACTLDCRQLDKRHLSMVQREDKNMWVAIR